MRSAVGPIQVVTDGENKCPVILSVLTMSTTSVCSIDMEVFQLFGCVCCQACAAIIVDIRKEKKERQKGERHKRARKGRQKRRPPSPPLTFTYHGCPLFEWVMVFGYGFRKFSRLCSNFSTCLASTSHSRLTRSPV